MQIQLTSTKHSCIPGAAELFTLKSERIGEYWPVIARFLSMIENPDWTEAQVREQLETAKAQCWGIAGDTIQGIWITKILHTEKTTYGLVWIAAGEGLDAGVPKFLEVTEPWFREMGCKYIEVQGRKGWIKAIPGLNYHLTVMRKYL